MGATYSVPRSTGLTALSARSRRSHSTRSFACGRSSPSCRATGPPSHPRRIAHAGREGDPGRPPRRGRPARPAPRIVSRGQEGLRRHRHRGRCIDAQRQGGSSRPEADRGSTPSSASTVAMPFARHLMRRIPACQARLHQTTPGGLGRGQAPRRCRGSNGTGRRPRQAEGSSRFAGRWSGAGEDVGGRGRPSHWHSRGGNLRR